MQEIPNGNELKPYFQNVHVIDVKTIDGRGDLRYFLSRMLSYYPWWIVLLYRLRELLVLLLGLERHPRPEALPVVEPRALSFTAGDKATFFVVRDACENCYWVAETPPDNHLAAYFGVSVEALSGSLRRFHVFTTVRYLHWTGPVYFNLIRPFHHLVVRRMMKAGVAP